MKCTFSYRRCFPGWTQRVTSILLPLAITLGIALFVAPTPALAATTYVFATFQSDSSAGQKLWIYTSSDAVSYTEYAATGFGGNTGVLRDPTLLKHSDGKYYIAFTNQHWSTASTTFGIASSLDLRTWTQVATVNSGIANTEFTWAPEWFNDGGTIKLIVNINLTTCNPDCFKSYVYTAQNSALTSWSAPVDMGLPACHIDTYAVRSGSTYHAFTVRCGGYVEHWTSSSLTGGWSNQGQLLSGYEGVSLVQMDNGTWRMYVDHYSAGDGIYTATSSNLNTWSSFTRANCSGCRHGTAVLDTSFGGTLPTYYRLTNRNSGKVADVNGASTANNAKVIQWPWNGGNNQQWQFVDRGSGYYNLVNRNSGKCLDVTSASSSDGALIIQYTCGSGNNQQFQWVAVSSYYQLRARHSGKCISIVGNSTADGIQLEQRTCSSTNNSMQWSRQ
jgi:hypothetical protein